MIVEVALHGLADREIAGNELGLWVFAGLTRGG